jgi:hypothetical protein
MDQQPLPRVPFETRLARFIPFPSARRAWLASISEREYRRDLKDARQRNDKDRIEHLKFIRMADEEYDQQSADLEYSKRLLAKARQLRVPVPSFPTRESPNGFWEESTLLGGYFLTALGVKSVREAIRDEERWLSDRRAHWIVWCTAITGVIGALTGLLAIIWHQK